MFLVGILTWWYGHGWRDRLVMIRRRISSTADYFSVGLLLSTLFSPFRQISAGEVDGSIGAQMRGLVDQMVSRSIGAFARIFMIIFGIIAITFQVVTGMIILLFWLVIPTFPILGLLVSVVGWVPSW